MAKGQTVPFMDRKTTVFVDIARAKPKSQSCNKQKKKTQRIEIQFKMPCSLKAWQKLNYPIQRLPLIGKTKQDIKRKGHQYPSGKANHIRP